MPNKFYLSDGTYINLDTKRPSANRRQLDELKTKHPAIYELFCEKVRAYNNARHASLDKEAKKRLYDKQQEWRASDVGKAQLAAYARRYRATNPQARILHIARHSIWQAMFNGQGIATAEEHLGCSIAQYRAYLEARFVPGMSWENYGSGDGKWCIDHVKPVTFFNLEDPEELKQALRWTNTQPIWFHENLEKWQEDKAARSENLPLSPSSSVSLLLLPGHPIQDQLP